MMNNLQATLLFPVRDADARKQWLIASAITLAGFIIPILPTLVVMGYSVKIMRQVIHEGREPSMPDGKAMTWARCYRMVYVCGPCSWSTACP